VLTLFPIREKVFLMNPLTSSLHLEFVLTDEVARRLEAWDAAQAAEPPLQPMRWHVYLERYLRSATVAASTQIEGNPMTLTQVEALLRGDPVNASRVAQLENVNYNHALELATSFALTPTYTWDESVIRVLNHQILRDLPDDRQGRYRDGPVTVGGFYDPPGHQAIGGLMMELVQWLREEDQHALVRVALLHLNLVAIHPFLDGNGRTARVASSLEMMRCGVGASELISVEPYLAEHRDEYFGVLRETLGESYAPDRHTATPWVNYAVGVYADRLAFEVRMREVWPYDLGTVADALATSHEPASWASYALLSAITPLRTRFVAETLQRSMPTARAMLNAMTQAGWLEFRGRTRAAAYYPGGRLLALQLRAPAIVERYVRGQTLGLEIT
jgi:hypothetical protein